jgi:hypothetical protein
MLARGSCCARGVAALTALLLIPFFVSAADAPPVRSYKLELKKMDGVDQGKTAVVKGEAGKTPHRFLVDGVNMNTPMVVLVRPVREEDEVSLRLTKYAWNQPLREGTAKGEPLAFKFRTEGEFQIAVSADKPTPYRLLVWAGEEVKPELRPVVIKASEFNGGSSSSVSPVMWVIAGALVAIAILLGVLVMRRKTS